LPLLSGFANLKRKQSLNGRAHENLTRGCALQLECDVATISAALQVLRNLCPGPHDVKSDGTDDCQVPGGSDEDSPDLKARLALIQEAGLVDQGDVILVFTH
jgi:hypothetical protein